jgi:hypothetical protein
MTQPEPQPRSGWHPLLIISLAAVILFILFRLVVVFGWLPQVK